jgi:hypothetical protein
MSGKISAPGRDPVLPTADQTFGLPDWRDGELPHLDSRVLIVHEVAYSIVCSAVVPPRMSIREMLQDYVGLRAFEEPEMKLAITYEVVAGGTQIDPPARIIATRKSRRITLRKPSSDFDWARAVRSRIS